MAYHRPTSPPHVHLQAGFLCCALLLLRASVVAERKWGSHEAAIAGLGNSAHSQPRGSYAVGSAAAAAAAEAAAAATTPCDYGAWLCRQELLRVRRAEAWRLYGD